MTRINRQLASRAVHPRWTVIRIVRTMDVEDPWFAESPGSAAERVSQSFPSHQEALDWAISQAAKPQEACS